MEDTFTHNHFNNLANRYYESLACRCVLLFDESCINTLKLAGITDYEQFIINSPKDYEKYTEKNYPDLLKIQLKWRDKVIEERINTVTEIENVIAKEMENALSENR